MSTYDMQERARFAFELLEVERASLQERREARLDWETVLREHPEIVAERASWLLAGNYGQGAYIAAQEWILRCNARRNRRAWLGIAVAALEWRCPSKYARQAYLGLSEAERIEVDRRMDAVIARYRAEHAPEVASRP